MEAYHKKLLKFAIKFSGDGELRQYTLHKALLQLLGYDWWDPPEWTFTKFIKRILYPMSYIFLLLFVAVLTVYRCLSIDTETKLGFLIFMNNITVAFTFSYAALKTMYMKFSYGKEAKHLIQMLADIGDLKQGRMVWENSLKAFSYYMALLMSTTFLWTVYFTTFWGALCYETAFPWYHKSGPGYLAAFLCDFFAGIFCAVGHATMDSIISVSCGIIAGHQIVLRDMLQTIGEDKSSDQQLLRDCIDLHVTLNKAAEMLNYCFNLLFAIQAVYTVLHGCVIIYTFVRVEDVTIAIFNTMPMLMASYTELFMYSYYGQKLSSSFEDITFATYNNYWYDCDLSIQKSLMNMAMISEKPVALRGLGNYKASYASYLESLQESISYYLILKTVMTSS